VNLRAVGRAVALGLALVHCVLRYWFLRWRGPLSLPQRALWLQSAARGILTALGIHCNVEGHPPARGLVVSNHLSYLDIVILSATMPCFFVAKSEIDRWPFFGKAARTGGTLFIDRSSRASAAEVARQIVDRLALPIPVLFFPEGTSSDGSQVLRFHPSLFDPAAANGAPVTAAAVRYHLDCGRPESELCWYDNQVFLSHLWKALGASGFSADVRFGEPHVYPDRRAAAAATHAEVVALRSSQPAQEVTPAMLNS
jgi:1-acyl-sn-glycerol-3-phosphate acyltransferase